MNKEDKKLYCKLNENIKIPQSCRDTIYNTFDKLPEKEKHIEKHNKLRLSVAITFCSLFLITGIAFGKDIGELFQGLLSHNKGVISAIENNFVETNPSKYIESSNVKAYIDSVLMDDYKLCISLSFELPAEYAKENIHRIEIPNIIIYDENNNILYQMARKEIDYSFFNNPEISENNFSYQTSSSIGWAEKDGNIYSFSYIIDSNGFPKSKTINIRFDEINLVDKDLLDYELELSDMEIINRATLYQISGKWDLKYDLSEKTYNRENYIYRVKNYADYPFNFPEEIIVSNTETRFEFTYDLNDILQGEDVSIDGKAYIKTENDRIFTSNSEHEYIKNIGKCSYTFKLSKFNSSLTMQLIIPTDNGNDIVLELEKIE